MTADHYRRQSLWSIWKICWNINSLNAEFNPVCHLPALLWAHPILHVSRIRFKVHVRETDCKVVKGLLNISRIIPGFPPPPNLGIDFLLPQQSSSIKNSNLNWTTISLAPTVRYCYVRTSLFSHIYTLFSFRFLTQLIEGWCWPWINSAATSWPSKVAHILSVQ